MSKKPEWRAEHYHKLINLLNEARRNERGMEISDPDNINNPYSRDIQRYTSMINLIENFFEFDIYDNGGGLVIIKDKYILSLRNKRYRIKGKAEWFSYRKNQEIFDIMNGKVAA